MPSSNNDLRYHEQSFSICLFLNWKTKTVRTTSHEAIDNILIFPYAQQLNPSETFYLYLPANWQVKQLSTLQQWEQWAFREIRDQHRNLTGASIFSKWHDIPAEAHGRPPHHLEYWIDIFVLLSVIFSACDTWKKKAILPKINIVWNWAPMW